MAEQVSVSAFKGVNVDASPLHMQDGELTQAQNTVPDEAAEGGVCKRKGLNPVTPDAGDAILGGIGVPVPITVSTINGTLLVNDPPLADPPGGSGPGSGGGPIASPGTPNPGGSSASGGSGEGEGTGIPIHHTRWYRRHSATADNGSGGLSRGFWSSESGFTTPATEQLPGTLVENGVTTTLVHSVRTMTLQVDGVTYSDGKNFATSSWKWLSAGAPNCVAVVNNKIYFSPEKYSSDGPTGNTAGELWELDVQAEGFVGTIGRKILTVPKDLVNALATDDNPIVSMLANAGVIYFTVADQQDGRGGRVFYYDTVSGGFGQLGAAFLTADGQPISLAWHSGQLWTGTRIRAGTAPGKIFMMRPPVTPEEQAANQLNPIAWTLDETTIGNSGVSSLLSFNGYLYAGVGAISSSAIYRRDALGAWTSSLVGTGNRAFLGLIEFQGALYAAHLTPATSGTTATTIHKFDGTSWTTVHTTGTSQKLIISWTENNILFFGGGEDGSDMVLWSSPDGTTWTNRSANLTDTTGVVLGGQGVAVLLRYND